MKKSIQYSKKYSFLFCIVLLVFFCGVIKAHALVNKHVKVAYVEGKGLISDPLAVDRRGYGYDILKKIEERSEFTFEFIPYTHEEALVALKNKKVDLYGPLAYTEKWAEDFYFLSTPIGKVHSILASNSDEIIFYNDIEKINGSTVATTPDNPFLGEIARYLSRSKIDVKFIGGTYEDYHRRRADYYLTSNINDDTHNYKNAVNIATKDMYFVGNKENVELNREVNRELLDLATHERNFMERMYLVYYDNINLTKKYLSKDESRFLDGRYFKVGYTIDHQPVEYLNEEGKPEGISVQVLNLLAEKYNFTVEYFGYNSSASVAEKNKFDILISIQDEYPDIHKDYYQTDAYARLPMVLMLNSEDSHNFNRFDAISVGVYNYTTLDYNLIRDEFPNSTLHTYNGMMSSFSAFLSKEFDAGFFTVSGADYVRSVLGGEDTRIVGTNITLPLRFFISKKLSSRYLTAFNTTIRHLDDAEVNAIISEQSLVFTPSASMVELIQENLHYIIIFALFFISLIVLFFLYEQKKKRNQIQHIINTDSLTGLMSMHLFREIMHEKLEEAENNEYEIITLDIDYFRVINNIYGFEYGSRTIQAFAMALVEGYKNEEVLISRIVGELFVMLVKADSENNIESVCYKYVIPSIAKVVGKDYSLSMSIGKYKIDNTEDDVNVIVDRANIARLRGKQYHALTCNTFDEKMQKKSEIQTEIVFRMEQALKDKEFKVFYQPKIDYKTLKVAGAEALIRWIPEPGAIIYPNDFIPIFEANGFIMNLDLHVFEEVIAFIKAFESEINIPLISVNLSGRTLLAASTPLRLVNLMKKYQISPSKLEAEVTESAILDNDKDMALRVSEIKKLGLAVSMDDFGAGVSSLNRLAVLDVDTIKLDKSFLDYNSKERKGSAIVENIVRMAKDLNMKVVSEGVETAEQAHWLKEIGCDLAQGYYFERPLSQDDFVRLLLKEKTYTIKV